MTRRSPIPQTRRHIFVYDDDWTWLAERSENPGVTIREMVRKAVAEAKKRGDYVAGAER